tara:strand:+ start:432 stop:662 length:231 start_codon:yes stop_codon:yes gene_type:complete
MKKQKQYPFLRVEDTNHDKFISNGKKSFYIFPNPDNAGELQKFWVSQYDYKYNKVTDQRVISLPTLNAILNLTFYN